MSGGVCAEAAIANSSTSAGINLILMSYGGSLSQQEHPPQSSRSSAQALSSRAEWVGEQANGRTQLRDLVSRDAARKLPDIQSPKGPVATRARFSSSFR